jgi:hypothetical protein
MDEFKEFGGYAVDNTKNNIATDDEFSQFGGHSITSNSSSKKYSLGNRIASGVKSMFAGAVGAIPDTAALAYNIPVAMHNAQSRHNQSIPDDIKQSYQELSAYDPQYANYLNTSELPTIPSATNAIDTGIDNLTNGYTNSPEDQKYINEGLKVGSSFVAGGVIAKVGEKVANKAVSRLGNFVGNASPLQTAGAATAGGTMSYLSDQGASSAEVFGGGLASNIAVNSAPSLAKGAGRLATKGALSLIGLGKDQLKLDAIKAANDLNITLPAAVASESRGIALADQFLSKTPGAGTIMQKRYAKLGEKAIQELEKSYDSIINAKELEGVNSKIQELYKASDKLLPQNAEIVPKNIINATIEVKQELAKIASLTNGEKKLLQIANDYEQRFTPHNIKVVPTPVEHLKESQDSLGKIVDWRSAEINWGKEKRALALQKKLYAALGNDLAEYGKDNNLWFDFFKKADSLQSKVSRRKELTSLFEPAENHATGELSFNGLSKILHDQDTKTELKKLVEPEVFSRLEKLGTVSRAMAIKNKNTPNPSGTAVTQKTFDTISALTAGAVGAGATVNPAMTIATLLGAGGVAHLLTDKKILDLAIKFAETNSAESARKFNARMKAVVGYTPATILREAQNLEQQKQANNNNQLSDKLNRHIEENKKKPKGKALNELLEDENVGKVLDHFPRMPY